MTTTYTFEQLKEDVRKEAESLRVHATKEELDKLNLTDLDPNLPTECYYGLMTGSCTSPRAHELIAKCCVRLIDNNEFDHEEIDSLKYLDEYTPMSAEKLTSKRHADDAATTLEFISPIECYIMLSEAKNENLIAFLKGETDKLEL